MNLIEMMILISFIGGFVLLGIKVYNMSLLGKRFNRIWIFMTFAMYLVLWFILLLGMVFNPTPDTTIYQWLFLLNSMFMPVCILFSIAEFLLASASDLNDLLKKFEIRSKY